MSKSRGNTIDLGDSAETVASKVRGMYAGPPRGARESGKVAEIPSSRTSRPSIMMLPKSWT
jgi:tryptophanyl-tRNA synthetase